MPLRSHGSRSVDCACVQPCSPSVILSGSACATVCPVSLSPREGIEAEVVVVANKSAGCVRCHLVSGKPKATATKVAPIMATFSHQKFRQPEYWAIGPAMIGPIYARLDYRLEAERMALTIREPK